MPPTPGLGLAGQAFFGSLCAGTFGLGCWQTKRFFEKTRLIEERTEQLQLPPADFGSTALPFQRLKLSGRFVESAQVLVGPRGSPVGEQAQGMATNPQGFFILTPMQIAVSNNIISSSSNNSNKAQIVWINRGWIPRDMAPPTRREQLRGRETTSQQVNGQALLKAPQGVVDIVSVNQKFEDAKFVTAQHDMESDPPRMFWYDKAFLRDYLREFFGNTTDTVLLFTQLDTTTADDDDNNNSHNEYPIKPSVSSDFKITPTIHAGYAVTWYGMCAAGLYMTRILVSKGRIK